jgi:hypothetical protein
MLEEVFFRVVDIQWTRICKVEELRRLDQSVRNTALCDIERGHS